MPGPTMIAILGVDGSGKTTQARLLARWLREAGTPARAFENPGGRPATDRIAHRLGRRDTRALLGPTGQLAVETAVRGAAIARSLAWARFTGGVAVMDRYSYCQFALVRARGGRGERAVRTALAWVPTPRGVIYLDAPAAVAQARVELRGYDHEELATLRAFAGGYRSLPEWTGFHVVDGDGSIDDVHRRLRAVAADLLARGPGPGSVRRRRGSRAGRSSSGAR